MRKTKPTPVTPGAAVERIAFSPAEIAARYGLSRTLVLDEVREGRLEAVRLGRRILVSAEAEKAWLAGLAPAARNAA